MKLFLTALILSTAVSANQYKTNQHKSYTFKLTKQYLTDIKHLKNKTLKKQAYNRVKQFISLVNKTKLIDNEYKKLVRVNRFFNRLNYKDDMENYKQSDYWATVNEFLLKGSGDCEDFALAKYFTLINLGVDKKRLSLKYAMYKKKPHVVVLYQKDKFSKRFILDSTNKLVLPQEKRKHLEIYKTVKI